MEREQEVAIVIPLGEHGENHAERAHCDRDDGEQDDDNAQTRATIECHGEHHVTRIIG